MADVKRTPDESVPHGERYVSFADTDVADGDVIRVEESLGGPANTMTITIVGDGLALQVKINSRIKVAPRRKYPSNEPYAWVDYGYKNNALAVEQLTPSPFINVAARGAGTYSFTDIPIRDVEIDKGAGTGTFTIIFS